VSSGAISRRSPALRDVWTLAGSATSASRPALSKLKYEGFRGGTRFGIPFWEPILAKIFETRVDCGGLLYWEVSGSL
jgi:hypothetical protein